MDAAGSLAHGAAHQAAATRLQTGWAAQSYSRLHVNEQAWLLPLLHNARSSRKSADRRLSASALSLGQRFRTLPTLPERQELSRFSSLEGFGGGLVDVLAPPAWMAATATPSRVIVTSTGSSRTRDRSSSCSRDAISVVAGARLVGEAGQAEVVPAARDH